MRFLQEHGPGRRVAGPLKLRRTVLLRDYTVAGKWGLKPHGSGRCWAARSREQPGAGPPAATDRTALWPRAAGLARGAGRWRSRIFLLVVDCRAGVVAVGVPAAAGAAAEGGCASPKRARTCRSGSCFSIARSFGDVLLVRRRSSRQRRARRCRRRRKTDRGCGPDWQQPLARRGPDWRSGPAAGLR